MHDEGMGDRREGPVVQPRAVGGGWGLWQSPCAHGTSPARPGQRGPSPAPSPSRTHFFPVPFCFPCKQLAFEIQMLL